VGHEREVKQPPRSLELSFKIQSMVAFGPFTFDPANGLLRRADSEVPLPPRVLGVLAYLVARPGQVVARQDLLDAIWKDAFVTDTSLAEAVSSLRQALGDDPQQPVYIQTLHRRGYRFVAPLAPAPSAPAPGAPSAPRAPTAPAPSAPSAPSILGQLLPWSIAAILGAILVAAVWKLEYADSRPEPQAARFVVNLPAGSQLDAGRPAITIAPDGSRLAWSACVADRCGIWTRAIDDLDAAFVDGSDGGRAPFFSPDARRIGFFAGGTLRTISVAGGTAGQIAEADDALGASWSEDGRIVFSGGATRGLSVVGENGGRIEPLTRPDPGDVHYSPFHVPDAKAVIFSIGGPASRAPARAAILHADGTQGVLTDDAADARVVVPGLLVFKRASQLVGLAWDDRLMAIAGAPAPLASGVDQFALAASGTLVTSDAGRLLVALEWAREARKRVPPGVGRILR
jgi:DNA-binding winged helix-turn-helix (wHTH) protein